MGPTERRRRDRIVRRLMAPRLLELADWFGMVLPIRGVQVKGQCPQSGYLRNAFVPIRSAISSWHRMRSSQVPQ